MESESLIQDRGLQERLRQFIAWAYGGEVGAMAAAMKRTPSAIYQYLSQTRSPGAGVLAEIGALGCSIHWLVCGEGTPFAPNEAGQRLYEKLYGKPMELRTTDVPYEIVPGPSPSAVVTELEDLLQLAHAKLRELKPSLEGE